VGAGKVYGRDIVEAHYRACLYTGIRWEPLSVLRAPTTAVWALARCTAGTLWRVHYRACLYAGIRWEHLSEFRAPTSASRATARSKTQTL
jgi:hypothetical protein